VLLDTLDDLVHDAKSIGDQVRVEKERIDEIREQIRATIPEEIKQARWVVKEQEEMLAEAQREAERIIQQARERQERLISDDEVTKQAERAAAEIIQDARRREHEILLGAEDHADEILTTLGVNLSKFNTAVQRGRDRLAGKDTPRESFTVIGPDRLAQALRGAIMTQRSGVPGTRSIARQPSRERLLCPS